ncbi:U6 snRNA phosphodiesterase 1-like isoform X1 [Mobula birostris]|uniref:U6 snRNA phosphodiesterase 1-like isoform X1 n=1 Tax=Mobula birostris TaxID=1983395 RepID=UPI003B28B047
MFLVNYSSSEDEEEQKEQHPPSLLRPGVLGDGGAAGPDMKPQRLPIPDRVMGMFEQLEEHVDHSSKRDGRICSFPHQRGNWSTLVYLESSAEFLLSPRTLWVCEAGGEEDGRACVAFRPVTEDSDPRAVPGDEHRVLLADQLGERRSVVGPKLSLAAHRDVRGSLLPTGTFQAARVTE